MSDARGGKRISEVINIPEIKLFGFSIGYVFTFSTIDSHFKKIHPHSLKSIFLSKLRPTPIDVFTFSTIKGH